MEDPYTELAGVIVRLKEEIIEMQSVIIDLIRAVKENTDEVEANTAELMER